MAVSDGHRVVVVRDMGLVSQAFDENTLNALDGHLAIGHVRYSTTGSSAWRNSQPAYRSAGDHEFALAHNGNLVNTDELADRLGALPGTLGSDSDVMAEMIAAELAATPDPSADGRALERALSRVLPRLRGAFSLTVCDAGHMYGVRDPHGFRPLVVGRLDGGGWVLASETPALDIVGAEFVREVEPGEMVRVDATGIRSLRPFPVEEPTRTCVFEFVYFARSDGQLMGQGVHGARVRMGAQLAEQAPADADLVMGVPESGLPAAEGFAAASGIPYGQGLVRNRYIGRTFIAPNQQTRSQGVRMKLNPVRENVNGKRIVVVDDSIVRGTTTKAMVEMLRKAGAVEVHMRVSSPPYRWPCFYGMDTGTKGELIATRMTVDEIAEFIGVDSLAYLEQDRMLAAVGKGDQFCTACLDGNYPVDIPAQTPRA